MAKFIEKSVPMNLKIQVGATLHANSFGTPYVNEKISMTMEKNKKTKNLGFQRSFTEVSLLYTFGMVCVSMEWQQP